MHTGQEECPEKRETYFLIHFHNIGICSTYNIFYLFLSFRTLLLDPEASCLMSMRKFPDREALCPKRETPLFGGFVNFCQTLSFNNFFSRKFIKILNGEVLDITFLYTTLVELFS